MVGLSMLLSPSILGFVQANAAGGCVNYEFSANIINVSCKVNLSEIYKAVNNKNVLEKDPHRVWILNATIKVNPRATLIINQTDTSWLKITNKNNTEPNFISVSGALKIDGIKITSWDPSSKNVIRQNVNGSIPRPYIIFHKGSQSANITNSEIAFLGYASKSGGTNGFLYYHGGNGSSILNNTFHDMWDGFYSDSVGFITIKNNRYYNNLRYGIDPHSGSHDLTIIRNLVYNNSKIGIICSQDCYNIQFSNNTVHDNGLAGLMFSIDTNNSIAKNNYAYHEKIGISIYQSSNDKVYDNLVKSTNRGIYVAGRSSGNHIYNNTITNGAVGLYLHLDNNSRNNIYENNNLKNITHSNKRIAFVENTFTYAAYRNSSFYNFYNFYKKYIPITENPSTVSTITTGLNLLKNRPIPHGPFPYYAHPGQPPSIPYIEYFRVLLQHVKTKDPLVTNITDVDVHEGKIFRTNGSNAYDILFLFHNEYVTQSEYNNLRQFLSNGSIIVFTEANALYAEVNYNKTNDTITLVRGHEWRFDGSASRSIGERWLDENKEWTGSNFLDIPSTSNITYKNNPFNYVHGEEQYVTNPHAKILLDYRASFSLDKYPNVTVATYQMNYGKGKIINLGIWGHELIKNAAFLNYFDNVIMPIALSSTDKIKR